MKRITSTLLVSALLACAAFAQVTISDINQAGNLVAVTPSSVIEQTSPQPGDIIFQSTLPSNWSRGEGFTFALSFNGLTISGSGNAYGNSSIAKPKKVSSDG